MVAHRALLPWHPRTQPWAANAIETLKGNHFPTPRTYQILEFHLLFDLLFECDCMEVNYEERGCYRPPPEGNVRWGVPGTW